MVENKVINLDGEVIGPVLSVGGATPGPDGELMVSGIPDITGPAGVTGPAGLAGLDGPTGPVGPTGVTGPTGVAGVLSGWVDDGTVVRLATASDTVRIGTSVVGSSTVKVESLQSNGLTIGFRATTSATGVTAGVQISTLTNTSELFMTSFNSTNTGSIFGLARSDTSAIFTSAGSFASSRLIVGTQAASPLYFGTSDIVRLTITPTGEIGIGTQSPATFMQIQKNQNVQTQLKVFNNTAGAIASAGYIMESNSAVGFLAAMSSASTVSIDGVSMADSFLIGTNQILKTATRMVLITKSAIPMEFFTNRFRRMTITSTGEVGIGEASPAEELVLRRDQNTATVFMVENETSGTAGSAEVKLQAASAVGFVKVLDSAHTLVIDGVSLADSLIIGSNAAFRPVTRMAFITQTAAPIEFFTSAIRRVTVNSSGQVLVGTASPTGTELLKVAGSAEITTDMVVGGSLDHDGSTVGFYSTAPVTQAASIGQLVDSSGGLAGGAVAAVVGSGADTVINDNFASLTAKINAIESAIGASSGVGISA